MSGNLTRDPKRLKTNRSVYRSVDPNEDLKDCTIQHDSLTHRKGSQHSNDSSSESQANNPMDVSHSDSYDLDEQNMILDLQDKNKSLLTEQPSYEDEDDDEDMFYEVEYEDVDQEGTLIPTQQSIHSSAESNDMRLLKQPVLDDKDDDLDFTQQVAESDYEQDSAESADENLLSEDEKNDEDESVDEERISVNNEYINLSPDKEPDMIPRASTPTPMPPQDDPETGENDVEEQMVSESFDNYHRAFKSLCDLEATFFNNYVGEEEEDHEQADKYSQKRNENLAEFEFSHFANYQEPDKLERDEIIESRGYEHKEDQSDSLDRDEIEEEHLEHPINIGDNAVLETMILAEERDVTSTIEDMRITTTVKDVTTVEDTITAGDIEITDPIEEVDQITSDVEGEMTLDAVLPQEEQLESLDDEEMPRIDEDSYSQDADDTNIDELEDTSNASETDPDEENDDGIGAIPFPSQPMCDESDEIDDDSDDDSVFKGQRNMYPFISTSSSSQSVVNDSSQLIVDTSEITKAKSNNLGEETESIQPTVAHDDIVDISIDSLPGTTLGMQLDTSSDIDEIISDDSPTLDVNEVTPVIDEVIETVALPSDNIDIPVIEQESFNEKPTSTSNIINVSVVEKDQSTEEIFVQSTGTATQYNAESSKPSDNSVSLGSEMSLQENPFGVKEKNPFKEYVEEINAAFDQLINTAFADLRNVLSKPLFPSTTRTASPGHMSSTEPVAAIIPAETPSIAATPTTGLTADNSPTCVSSSSIATTAAETRPISTMTIESQILATPTLLDLTTQKELKTDLDASPKENICQSEQDIIGILDCDDEMDVDNTPEEDVSGIAAAEPALEMDTDILEENAEENTTADVIPRPESASKNVNKPDTIMKEAESLIIEDQIRPPILDRNDLKIPRHWRDEESKLMSNYQSLTAQELVKTKVGLEDILEADNSIKMWWYDAFGNDNGQIYLFGKVFDKTHNRYVSLCVEVKEVLREVFILPRKHVLDAGNVFQPRVVTLEDVQIELAQLLASKNIKTYKTEVCTRKYAFELTDVPKETQYIKLTYSYRDYGFSTSTSGVTFSRMFGTEIKPLKQFIIQNDIMGPCWLQIRNWGHAIQKRSCCAVEVTLYSHGECSVIKDTSGKPIKDGPPLNVLALSLEYRMNYIKNQNEILAIGGFSCPDVDICNQETATSSPFERFSFTRRLSEYDHSPETISHIHKEYEKTHNNIIHKDTEEAMLRAFLSKLQQVDADIVIGHNFTNSMLDILLHRMRKFKIENWSILGRRILTEFPSLQPYSGGMGFSYTQELSVMCGRLVCDTYTASQDLLTCKSYQLSDMALSELDVVREPYMIKNLDPALFEIELARHCSFDAYLAFEIAVKLQILPLTKQLTNLSGNLWSRSMNGARAERNEYLLSHAFYNEQFICPDKPLKSGKYDNDMDSKNPPVEPITSMSYEGGLVLEPQSGFHDQYVLLLDFNSLYPSIMQEYNVCFTTMHRAQPGESNYNPDDIPAIPDLDCPEGILPRLVRMFVEQRKHVKKLMKDRTLSASTRKQYHIEQMGLKLTANSMYGCLGSSISSYYARPLAMFITSKGREILQKTVELTQQMGYKVLYGDTDSIMVETKVSDFASAEAIARKIKTRVNKEYKHLEIDLDGMFRNTLLLKKKKYAGLSINKRYDGHLESTVEAKGLEIVRRDFCDISKRILKRVLTMILTSTSRSDLSKRIRFFIEEEATCIKKNTYSFNDFIIRKQISKEPEYYKNSNMPQVAVARIMRAKSFAVNENDIIPYVMCKSDQIGKPIPRMPEDVAEGKYAIDFDYYISHQILSPLRRICEHIPGEGFNDF